MGDEVPQLDQVTLSPPFKDDADSHRLLFLPQAQRRRDRSSGRPAPLSIPSPLGLTGRLKPGISPRR